MEKRRDDRRSDRQTMYMKRAHKKKDERLTAAGFTIFWWIVGGRIGGKGSGHGCGGRGGGVLVGVTLEGGKG